MPNLSDSCLVDRLPVTVNDLAREAGMTFPVSLRAFLRDARCRHPECVTLHLKAIHEPDVEVRTMLTSMRTVFSTARTGVRVASREALSGTAFTTLEDLDVDDCHGTMSTEQTTLFGHRNQVGEDDIAIYFVRSAMLTSGEDAGSVLNGCASFPEGSPGAVVARIASRWTLAHEVGHVLGLVHIPGEDGDSGEICSAADTTRLMTGCGTGAITGTPTVSDAEIETINDSALTRPC